MPVYFTYTIPLVANLDVRREPDINIRLNANSQPGELTCRINGEPLLGTTFLATDPVTFLPVLGGSILQSESDFQEGDCPWKIRASDWTWLLNRRLPRGSWTNVSATTVILFLISNYTSGFTGNKVASGLPNVTLTLDGTMQMNAVFDNIAGQIGGAWRIDATLRDISFGIASGDDTLVEVSSFFVGNGVATNFVLPKVLVPTPGSGSLGHVVVYDNGVIGPVSETISAPGGGGMWEFDFGTNSITRTLGPPVTPADGLPNIGMIAYWTDAGPEDYDDNNLSLIRDPAPKIMKDITQLRNRVIVRGVGSLARTNVAAAITAVPVDDISPFLNTKSVAIASGVHTVTILSFDPAILGISPALPAAISAGTMVRIRVVVDDAASQAALAAIEGGDGVHEASLDFSDWTISPAIVDAAPGVGTRATAEYASLTTRGQAALDAWADQVVKLEFDTRDPSIKPGVLVVWNLTDPPIVGTFKVQEIGISQIHVSNSMAPRYSVKAAPYKFNFDDILRLMSLGQGGGGSGSSGGGFGGGGGGGGGGTPPPPTIPAYFDETPTGAVNGVNTLFTVANTYRPGTLEVFKNGVHYRITTDYTETTGTTFTMVVAPLTGDSLVVNYRGY